MPDTPIPLDDPDLFDDPDYDPDRDDEPPPPHITDLPDISTWSDHA